MSEEAGVMVKAPLPKCEIPFVNPVDALLKMILAETRKAFIQNHLIFANDAIQLMRQFYSNHDILDFPVFVSGRDEMISFGSVIVMTSFR